MRKMLFVLSLGAALSASSLTAEAMPADLDAGAAAKTPAITLVSGGCGIGFHRGPFGGCRPNGWYGYGGFYGRPYYGWWRGGWYGGWRRGWRRW